MSDYTLPDITILMMKRRTSKDKKGKKTSSLRGIRPVFIVYSERMRSAWANMH